MSKERLELEKAIGAVALLNRGLVFVNREMAQLTGVLKRLAVQAREAKRKKRKAKRKMQQPKPKLEGK